ncbi:MAG: hypothetical protein A2W99_06490 [Bacteroidetes bacterium GWF2_33_16]|nr:MAG: hypothetical protein A2X00_11180 [Bacteroidetes bacterium GWE2_32_14]OFY05326.1 MAG: hypothetical protein A2W99_06490 [Bacteroidetes bacterium GWF2_33_16]
MEKQFYFPGSEDKPKINFDPKNNVFEIMGNSYPEESPKFYIPLINWVTEYSNYANDKTHVVCKFEYFNSLSAKLLYELFFELQKITESGKKVSISWYYDPNDHFILEKGQEYKNVLEIPFDLISY